MKHPEKILKEFVVTEKASGLAANLNQYTFDIDPSANRIEVARAIEETFKVGVARVNILNTKPKKKRSRVHRNMSGYKPGKKRAIITLRAGDAIDVG